LNELSTSKLLADWVAKHKLFIARNEEWVVNNHSSDHLPYGNEYCKLGYKASELNNHSTKSVGMLLLQLPTQQQGFL